MAKSMIASDMLPMPSVAISVMPCFRSKAESLVSSMEPLWNLHHGFIFLQSYQLCTKSAQTPEICHPSLAGSIYSTDLHLSGSTCASLNPRISSIDFFHCRQRVKNDDFLNWSPPFSVHLLRGMTLSFLNGHLALRLSCSISIPFCNFTFFFRAFFSSFRFLRFTPVSGGGVSLGGGVGGCESEDPVK